MNLFNHLVALHREFDLDQVELMVVIEYMPRQAQGAQRHLMEGWLAMTELFCVNCGHDDPLTCIVTQWRNYFLSHDDFLVPLKCPPELVGNSAKLSQLRQNWWKQKIIEKCQSLGINPETTDEADAIGIGFWVVKGGLGRSEAKKSKRKREKKNARSQKDLGL